MANFIIENFSGGIQTFADTDVTVKIATLAASATAGWQSAAQDNTVNLYDDVLITLTLGSAAYGTGAANTAYIFAYAGIETVYTSPGAGQVTSGTVGGITLPNVTSAPVNLPLIGQATAIGTAAANLGPFSVARAFGGVLPLYWGIAVINNTAATFTGGVAKWIGLKYNANG